MSWREVEAELAAADGCRAYVPVGSVEGETVSATAALKPLEELASNPDPDTLATAIKSAVESLGDVDGVQRMAFRDGAVRALKDKGVRAATGVVDAAMVRPEVAGASQAVASKLGVRDPEPWPDPVDGAGLLTDIARLFEKYLVLPATGPCVLALWVLHTHALAAMDVSPYLAITSPTKRCGKTTLLGILKRLVARAVEASSITAAGVFRVIEAVDPTLIIDEADSVMERSEELRCILNSGFTRDTAFAIRCEGEDREPKRFSTFGPKAIGLIGKLPDTLQDRSIEIRMLRRKKSETVARMRRRELGTVTIPLARRAARWANDHADELEVAQPHLPEDLGDREGDLWEPLLAIADAAGGAWPARARAVALGLRADDGADGFGRAEMLLADVRAVFKQDRRDRIPVADIAKSLNELEDRPWADSRGGKGISTSSVSRTLGKFGVKSKPMWIATKTARGFVREELADAFERYLPADPPQESVRSVRNDVSGETATSSEPYTSDGRRSGRDGPFTSESAENPHCERVLSDPYTPYTSTGGSGEQNIESDLDEWIEVAL